MPRQPRKESSSGFYHVMIRGNNRESIFRKLSQKKYFLDILELQVDENMIKILGYCVMDNHVHIILQADVTQLAEALKSINIQYAMRFNLENERIGHVFQDRFKSVVIPNDQALLRVLRYVNNNPVKAGIVEYAGAYAWSGFNGYIHENKLIKEEQREFILGFFFNKKSEYIKFHELEDSELEVSEHLEMKEDIIKEKLAKAHRIINAFNFEKGILDFTGNIEHSRISYINELGKKLLMESALTELQIATLLGTNKTAIHKIRSCLS